MAAGALTTLRNSAPTTMAMSMASIGWRPSMVNGGNGRSRTHSAATATSVATTSPGARRISDYEVQAGGGDLRVGHAEVAFPRIGYDRYDTAVGAELGRDLKRSPHRRAAGDTGRYTLASGQLAGGAKRIRFLARQHPIDQPTVQDLQNETGADPLNRVWLRRRPTAQRRRGAGL